jgi:transcriptional regulator with XRE-family HTH domain
MSPRNKNPDQVSPLRAARLRAGLSMEVLAVRAGLSRATVYLAEKAPQLMSDRTVNAVAKVLGVEPAELRP